MDTKEHLACLHEQDWGALWEVMKTHTLHVTEGDKSGGFRDRLLLIEREVKELRNRFWYSAAIGGVVGGLLGSGAKDIITIFLSWLMKK